MALVGALTLQALGQAFLVEGRARAAAAQARFDAEAGPPTVDVDLSGAGDAGDARDERAAGGPAPHHIREPSR
jgi:hypothetical protein